MALQLWLWPQQVTDPALLEQVPVDVVHFSIEPAEQVAVHTSVAATGCGP
jgi:hypothetical protein